MATEPSPSPGLFGKLRRALLRAFTAGMATLLPTIVTIYLLVVAYDFINEEFGKPINSWIRVGLQHTEAGGWCAVNLLGVDPELVEPGPLADEGLRHQRLKEQIEERYSPVIGFIAGLLIVMAVGVVVAGVFGRQFLKLIERQILKIPVIKSIYPYAKQITEFIFKAEEKKSAPKFSAVLAVPWPNDDVYSVAFMTGGGLRQVTEWKGKRHITCFIPTAPTPFTGFVIFVEADRCLHLDLSVDDALRLLISGGVILPPDVTDMRPVTLPRPPGAVPIGAAGGAT